MSTDTEPTELDDLKEIVLNENKELDKEVPGSAFGLVTFSYLIVLLLFVAVIGAFYWLAV